MSEERLQAVKGMNDLLPSDSAKWQHVERAARRMLECYGYREVRTPVVEATALFSRAIGVATDIVEKEMYTFADRDDKALTLRPEGTAGAVRAYLEHQLAGREPITRWFYSGPMFRRERPQKGRYRQFYQIGAEALGVAEPTLDAEMIGMLVTLFQQLGIQDVDVVINSVGSSEDRPAYRQALVAYLGSDGRQQRLCENCVRRMESNPLRVLDCKVPTCAEIAASAPSILDHLGPSSRTHWEAVLANLAALEVAHVIDTKLVRGLDYYTGTVFEVRGRGPGLGSQNALCGGGRYDRLVETLGGPATPAVGFAFGVERLVATVPGSPESFECPPVLMLISHGATALTYCLRLAQRLRAAGHAVEIDHRAGSMKSQMKRADKLRARYVGVVGESELAAGTIMLKKMATSEQSPISEADLISRLDTELIDGRP